MTNKMFGKNNIGQDNTNPNQNWQQEDYERQLNNVKDNLTKSIDDKLKLINDRMDKIYDKLEKEKDKRSSQKDELKGDMKKADDELKGNMEKANNEMRKWLITMVIIVIILAFFSGANCIEFIIKTLF